MNPRSASNLTKIEKSTLKYLKNFVEKIPQVIVQSRCGEKKPFHVKSSSEVYDIGIQNNPEIQEKTSIALDQLDLLMPFSLCVEILLKTAEGDMLVLETWCLQSHLSEKYFQQNHRMFADSETIFRHFTLLLKSTVCVTRVIPAFKLSFRQSAETHVMLYRIYVGDPQVDQLGTCPQVKKIGEVYTPVGTVSMSITYRSKSEMIIVPQKADKENFLVKSDYFNADMSPKKQFGGFQFNKKLRSPCGNSNSYQNAGAFAPHSTSSDTVFPELEFLEKPFLNLSRSALREKKKVDDTPVTMDSNLNYINETTCAKEECIDKDFERLSCSGGSDCSDFVLLDIKPSFASYNRDCDLQALLQPAPPPLSSLSGQTTLKDQVTEVTNLIEKFETSMSEFDTFVDSVCQLDSVK